MKQSRIEDRVSRIEDRNLPSSIFHLPSSILHPPSSILVIGVVTLLFGISAARGEEPIRLREDFPVGYQYHVSTHVELSGSLTLPAEKGKLELKPLAIKGESAIEYDERILGLEKDDRVQKTTRIYRRIDFQRKVGDTPQQNSLRPQVAPPGRAPEQECQGAFFSRWTAPVGRDRSGAHGRFHAGPRRFAAR